MGKKTAIVLIFMFVGSMQASEALPLHHLDMNKLAQLVSSARIAKEYFRQVNAQHSQWGEGVTKKMDSHEPEKLRWEKAAYRPSSVFITTEHNATIQVNEIWKNKVFKEKETFINYGIKTKIGEYRYYSKTDTYHHYPPSP